ncbi:MAG: UDP-N-acetylglucosamine 2-epimerase (hydrolyzing) [Actinobacteria bacterium]|nr:UDP-N-acetylglucosamine 2-epimerase (hydrolyzing) [Actinomycetota bacterium]
MRTIAVFTGTRAEYGLLYWVLRELEQRPEVALQLIVAGTHLSPEYGHTVDVIVEDGFPVGARIEMLLSSDTPVGVTKSGGLALIGLADALDRLQPDLLLLVGDRYEAAAAAFAAAIARVPVAHIHGGEVTEGAVDDQLRHAITKLSHLHLVAAPEFARRVTQMGEDPACVHVVGAPGLDHVLRLDLLDRSGLEAELGLELRVPTFLVTYHPATRSTTSRPGLVALIDALERFPDATVVFTYPNADVEGRALGDEIERYVAVRPGPTGLFTSLGQRRYLSAVRHADVVVGNSSSGLIEAPALGTPTVNIGPRQQGRLRGETVIDAEASSDAIESAIRRALEPDFRELCASAGSPYGDGRSAARIVDIVTSVDLAAITRKRFHDVGLGEA